MIIRNGVTFRCQKNSKLVESKLVRKGSTQCLEEKVDKEEAVVCKSGGKVIKIFVLIASMPRCLQII